MKLISPQEARRREEAEREAKRQAEREARDDAEMDAIERGQDRPHVNGKADDEGFDLLGADVALWRNLEEPTVEFLVADLLPLAVAFLLAGDGGAGKSLLCQILATCVAADKRFMGRAVKTGRAVFITGEDALDILRVRQGRICRELGTDRDDLAGKLFIRSMADADMFLWSNGKLTRLAARLEAELLDLKPTVVLIDSAVFAFDDDEIKRRTVAGFLVYLNRLARRLGDCSIGLVTHTSRAGGASGSTAWNNQARAGLLVEKQEDGPVIKLLKVSYAREQPPIELRWTDEGVLVLRDAPDTGTVATIQQQTDDRIVLAEITKAFEAGDPFSTGTSSVRNLGNAMAAAGRMSKKRANAAHDRLRAAGKIGPIPSGRLKGLRPTP